LYYASTWISLVWTCTVFDLYHFAPMLAARNCCTEEQINGMAKAFAKDTG